MDMTGHPGPDGLRAADEYEHEDAFQEANKCAERLTSLSTALAYAKTEDEKAAAVYACRAAYQKFFSAFIAGVDYGRRNPK